MAGRGVAVTTLLFYISCSLLVINHLTIRVDCLSCLCSPCEDYLNETCQTGPGGKCFALIHEEEDGQQYWTFGCVTQEEGGTPLMCMANSIPTQYPRAIECCDNEDFCNDYLEPPIHLAKTLPPPVKHNSATDNLTPWEIFGLSAGVTLTVLSVAFFFIWCRIRQKGKCAKFLKSKEDCLTFETESHVINEVAGISSGSGSGQRILVQRTIGREVELKQVVGKGRYGEVWKAIYQGESVAVKILPTTQDASFSNEVELYKTVLGHENILRYIMADIISGDSGTKMLLVTAYHDNGSLYDYLNTHVLDLPALLNMALSIMGGLTHLHSNISGIAGFSKPCVAHRDLKSKNILVKKDLTCCICDLGLAVSETGYRGESLNTRQGTVRYMAPEVLNGTINKSSFESLKKADMYSISLVFWEMARRCDASGPPEEYQIPYFDDVVSDPSFEEMKEVVCTRGIRPPVDPRWLRVPALESLVGTMTECWHAAPESRVYSLRVKKNLMEERDNLDKELPLVRVL